MKHKKYWLRGAIIAVLWTLLVFFAAYLYAHNIEHCTLGDDYCAISIGIFAWPFALVGFIVFFLLQHIPFFGSIIISFFSIPMLGELISAFATGALYGWLYGKIKNRNTISQI